MSTSRMVMGDVEHGVVMSHPGADRIPEAVKYAREADMRSQHYGWPGVAVLPNGDVVVSASERILHVDPFGRTVISRSTDGGRTFSEPTVFFDSRTDDRDASLVVLADGTLVATWFTSQAWTLQPKWESLLGRVRPDDHAALCRGWLRRSHDGGRTWEPQVYPTIVGQHAGPAVTSTGDLIYCGPYEDEKFVATRSSDGGKTWAIIGQIPMERITQVIGNGERNRLAFNENHCIEVSPGHLLCALRKTLEPRTVCFSQSRDGGCTWSKPRDTGVYGFPPFLLKLSCGAILCVFSDRREPRRAIRGMLSYDNGQSWDTDNLLMIAKFEHLADMGYPVAVELSPGRIFCVYYYVPRGEILGPTQDGGDGGAGSCLAPDQVGVLSAQFDLQAV